MCKRSQVILASALLTLVCFLRSVLSMDLETGGDSSFIYGAIVQGATACNLCSLGRVMDLVLLTLIIFYSFASAR